MIEFVLPPYKKNQVKSDTGFLLLAGELWEPGRTYNKYF